MPYYQWKGIQKNKILHGQTYAESGYALSEQLASQNITILFSKNSVIRDTSSLQEKALLCQQMAQLLAAHVQLIDALRISVNVLQNSALKSAFIESIDRIQEGKTCARTLQEYSCIDSVMVHLISIGEETGSLSTSFRLLHTYYKTKDEIAQQLRATLIMPLITLSIVVITTLALLFIVFPKFQNFFTLLSVPIPAYFFILLNLKWLIAALIFILFFFMSACFTNEATRKKCVMHVPFIKNLYKDYYLAQIVITINVLLLHDVSLHHALKITVQYFPELASVLSDIEQGISFQSALSQNILFKNYRDIITLCHVGEATGNLPVIFNEAAHIMTTRCIHNIKKFSQKIPLFVLLVVSALLLFLISALYVPLLTLVQSPW